MKKMELRRKSRLLSNFENFLICLASLVWGVTLMIPGTGLHEAWESANPFLTISPSIAMGILFLVAACLKIYGIYKPESNTLGWGGFLAFLLWSFTFWIALLVNPTAPVTILLPIMSVWNGWLYLKARLMK